MKLRSVEEILPDTKVVLKMDLDVPMESGIITNTRRLEKSIPTIKLLLSRKCKIVIIGKLGRPEGKEAELSLKPVYLELMSLLEPEGENLINSIFIDEAGNFEKIDTALGVNDLVFLENLRFWKGEENNDPNFLKNLVQICQFYVNDALAVAHRKERSNMLFKDMPAFYGLQFIDEVEKIMKVVDSPQRPLTIILGGAKEDKLNYLEGLTNIADHVLVGGKLPKLINDKRAMTRLPDGQVNDKVIVAELRDDGWDLSGEDIAKFKDVIKDSKMVIWAGAMGWFEKESAKTGTIEIAKGIAESGAYTIVAGGDTATSLKQIGVENKINLTASGGGMLLELLTKGKLPAWE